VDHFRLFAPPVFADLSRIFVCLCSFMLLRHLSDTNAPSMWDFFSRVGLHFNYLDMTDLFAIHAALWTLAVEIQFYLFLPMASLFVLLL
jgi:peptidoglycan/LPS O-acetylase OafA/YrhL